MPMEKIRRRRGKSAASFVFRGVNPRGANTADESTIPLPNGDTINVTVEPWRPQAKPPKFKKMRDEAFSVADVVANNHRASRLKYAQQDRQLAGRCDARTAFA